MPAALALAHSQASPTSTQDLRLRDVELLLCAYKESLKGHDRGSSVLLEARTHRFAHMCLEHVRLADLPSMQQEIRERDRDFLPADSLVKPL